MDDSITYDDMPTSVLEVVNERCNRYEADRVAGKAQSIDDYVCDLDDEARTIVRAELLALSNDYKQSTNEAPATIGDYDILRCLGRGGMGSVYLARDPRLGRNVAVKVLRPALAADPSARDRFRREALASGRLDHPNVVPALDAGEENGSPYLVSAYVDGEDLARLVRRNGPLDNKLAIDYVIQAAHGLEHAHERGIVHRDVKPANLIVGNDGIVRVLDLGLARIRDVSAQDQTATGIFMGTPSYAAPEQIVAPITVDARTDIYGLGGVLHYLITGRAPRPWEDFRGLPAEIGRPLRQMLASNPAQRPESMAEVIRLLENSPKPSRRGILVAGTIAVFGATGGALVYFKPWREEKPPTKPPIVPAFEFSEEQRKAAAEYNVPVERTDEYGISFVLIPPGQSWVGSTPEEIERIVALEPDSAYQQCIRAESRRVIEFKRPFYLARTELTIGQMKAIVGQRGRIITDADTGKESFVFRNGQWKLEHGKRWDNAGPEYPLTDEHPAINYTWFDASLIARSMSSPNKDGPKYHLPTEDAWEYACLAGRPQPEVDAKEDVAVFDVSGPLPVRSRLPNHWGLFDMLGNLLEWCLFAPLAERPEGNLFAPLRGGKFNDKTYRIRPAARFWATKVTPYGGLRLAMAAVTSPTARDRAFGKKT